MFNDDYHKYTAECESERILKISRHWENLWGRYSDIFVNPEWSRAQVFSAQPYININMLEAQVNS